MTTFIVILCITALLISAGAHEYYRHRRNLSQIAFRIHVNGTRGKSSVTRLIAAGLREGGVPTCAKTTGTLPRFILPDGVEYPVYRPSRANVIEQVRIVEAAVEAGARALVIECMALQPPYQWLSESKLVRATHGVVTNAREDHLDVMGPEERDVAKALAAMTPLEGRLYLGRSDHGDVFEFAARDRGTEFTPIDAAAVEAVTEAELAGFSYIEHAENVALALRICEDIGVQRDVALRGMQAAQPDPGAMTYHEVDFFGRKIIFVNAFAANDPESTRQLWDMAREAYPDAEKRIALLNCRHDRQDRSRQLGQAAVAWQQVDRYVLMGSGTFILARFAEKAGADMLKFAYAENLRVDDIFETLVDGVRKSVLIVGMGNIGGQGLETVRYFNNRQTSSGAMGRRK